MYCYNVVFKFVCLSGYHCTRPLFLIKNMFFNKYGKKVGRKGLKTCSLISMGEKSWKEGKMIKYN